MERCEYQIEGKQEFFPAAHSLQTVYVDVLLNDDLFATDDEECPWWSDGEEASAEEGRVADDPHGRDYSAPSMAAAPHHHHDHHPKGDSMASSIAINSVQYTEQIVIGSNAISHCHRQQHSSSSSMTTYQMKREYHAESIAISSTQFSAQRIQNGNGAVHINSQCSTMYTNPLWQCLECKWFNIAHSSRCISCFTERPSSSLNVDDLIPPDWSPLSHSAFNKHNDHHQHRPCDMMQSVDFTKMSFAAFNKQDDGISLKNGRESLYAQNSEISASKSSGLGVSCGREMSASCYSMESESEQTVEGGKVAIHSNL